MFARVEIGPSQVGTRPSWPNAKVATLALANLAWAKFAKLALAKLAKGQFGPFQFGPEPSWPQDELSNLASAPAKLSHLISLRPSWPKAKLASA